MSQYPSLKELGIRLSAIDIHQKEFKTAFRGYDPDQINEYLDEVIRDYQAFEDIVQKLELEIKQLKKKLAEPRPEPRHFDRDREPELPFIRQPERPLDIPMNPILGRIAEPVAAPDSERSPSQMELIDRVRELEKFCFGRARD